MDEVSEDQYAQNQQEQDPENFLIGEQDEQLSQMQKPQKQILKQKSSQPIPVTKQIQKPVQTKTPSQGKFNLQQYRQNKLLQKQNSTLKQQNQKPTKQQRPPSKIRHRQWDPSWKIISLQKPEYLDDSVSKTKRYLISFQYVKPGNKKRFQASVRFGYKQAKYIIDFKQLDPTQQLLKQQINFVKNVSNDPFKANYWVLQLLNNPQFPTLESAFINFQQKIIFHK